jgi:hypothetical protein
VSVCATGRQKQAQNQNHSHKTILFHVYRFLSENDEAISAFLHTEKLVIILQ